MRSSTKDRIKSIYRIILSSILMFAIVFNVSIGNVVNIKAEYIVSESNPISFAVVANNDNSVTNGFKYTINVSEVYSDNSITYKTVFLTYPKELNLKHTSLPTGYNININATTGNATLFVIDENTTLALMPGEVKTFLETLYFELKNPNIFPNEGSVIAISASKNRIAFYEDERGYLHYYEFVSSYEVNWMNAYNAAKQKTMVDPFTGKTMQGYLATVTSYDEQKMIYNSIAKLTGHIGGTRMVRSGTKAKIADENSIPTTITSYYYDTASGSKWYWATGPEAWTTPIVGQTPPYEYNDKGTGSPLVFWGTPLYSGGAGLIPGVFHAFNNPTAISVKTGLPAKGAEPNGAPNEYVAIFSFGGADTWNDAKYNPTAPWQCDGYYIEYGGYIGDPNTNDMNNALNKGAVKLSMPVKVQYRSIETLDGEYKQINLVGTNLDKFLVGTENNEFNISSTANELDGYVFTGYHFDGNPNDEINLTSDTNSNIKGVFSQSVQTITLLYKYEPLTISLNPATDKKYKPNFPATTAHIDTIGTITPDKDVKYIMLPTTDTDIIATKADFEAKYALVPDEFKGKMQFDDITNIYDMYDINNPNLSGVLENCKLWVMATGTNSNDSSEVAAFDSHVFTNIYTPINVYHKGEMTSGSALYANTRVGVSGDLTAVYGIPLDLDGSIINNPQLGYDEIDVIHEDLVPLWTFNSAMQDDVTDLTLDNVSYMDKEYSFVYDKDVANWFSATFEFVDESEVQISGTTPEIVADFIPNDSGQKTYMLAKDLYAPPDIAGYDPIGYIANGELIKYTSFPLKYGAIVLTSDNETVKIVYRSDDKKVVEKYYLFEADEYGNEVFKEEIKGFEHSTTSVLTGNTFDLVPPSLYGYVYKGYSTDDGSNYTDGSPATPITIYSDTTIIYKYKADATLTGIADEDIKRIVVSGVGINAKGQVEKILYTDDFNEEIGQYFTPIAQGINGGNGKIIIAGDGNSQWILDTTDLEYLDSVTSFQVTGNKAVKFRYHKDTSGNGVPDYLEANITIKYYNESTNQPLLNELLITEHSPDESFSRVAPVINGNVAVGVIINKDGDPEGTPVYSVGTVKGEIGTLGAQNWVMKFLYQPDTNNNGIGDNVEAKITVKTVYKLTNGQEETELKEYIGRHGAILLLSAASLNKNPSKFEYVNGLASENATYTYNNANPQNIIVNFKEKVAPTPTPDNNNSDGGDDGGTPTPSQPSSKPKPTPDPKPPVKPVDTQGSDGNNYSWSTFEKPEVIFLDGELMPLGSLIFNGPYINGYPDKTIGPDKNLTRAEAAQIIYNLYGRPDNYVEMDGNLPYHDVSSDAWYAKAVAFLTQYKIVTGYPDGLFYPNKTITRAELVTLLAKYKNIPDDTANEIIFNDVEGHWAKPQINAANKDNIITGFSDGTFKPNDLGTRSEAVTIINKMLKRPDKWIGENEYTDLKEQDWAYEKLMNAANGYVED